MKSLCLILLATLFLLLSCSQKEPEQLTKEPKEEIKTDSSANVDENENKTRNDESSQIAKTENILGAWLRPDGGYILEIKRFTNNSIEAAYYNPKPINISETQWKFQDGYVYLFIKFDDEGYPGSYYSLGYYPEKDMLIGFYYQAVAKQTFDVYFEREN